MKKIFFILFSMFFFSSCNKTKNTEDNCKQIEMDKSIEPIVVDFIKKNFCNECLYEMYVDKKSPYLYEVILYKGYRSLTFEENKTNKQIPLFYTKILDKKVNIYSGVEHFFNQKKQKDLVYKKKKIPKEFDLWVITDSLGHKKIDIVSFAYPFLPKPKNQIQF